MIPVLRKKRNNWRGFIRSPAFDTVQFLLLVLLFLWFFAHSLDQVGYNWQWYQIPRFIYTFDERGFVSGPLLQGLQVTLQISAVSLILAFFVGLVTALMRLSSSMVAKSVARLYLEVSRNTPLLIQLFFIYFVMGPILGMNRFFSAVLALSLFEGAYVSEILRSGITSVHRGQWEAASSLGLTQWCTYRFIILPQAVRRILPPLTNQAISLIKDSSLVSVIAVYDLTMQAQALISETFLSFELWLVVALVYLLLTITLSYCVTLLEKKINPHTQH
ncbi:MAG: amino acid ABC transporter permease [Desulfobulbaceae bacterium]